jgi:hypothetical protein
LKDPEKWGVGSKWVWKNNGRVKWTMVKHTYTGNTLRHPFGHILNIYNENQDCKISSVWEYTNVSGEEK